MLATMGPQPAEQVIVFVATGSGKTLIVMVSAALEGAATTMLILPTVDLRGNMLGRLGKIELKHHAWSPGSTNRHRLSSSLLRQPVRKGFSSSPTGWQTDSGWIGLRLASAI